MNNNEFTQKNEIILFKNEILGDLKKIQLKYENKFSQISEYVTSQMTIIDQKVKDITNLINNLNQKLEEKNEMEILEQKLNKSLKNMQDLNVKLEIKYNILNKDFKDSCFRYDKIISNNLLVPGVIGDGCTYENLRPFIEYINIKISELIKCCCMLCFACCKSLCEEEEEVAPQGQPMMNTSPMYVSSNQVYTQPVMNGVSPTQPVVMQPMYQQQQQGVGFTNNQGVAQIYK